MGTQFKFFILTLFVGSAAIASQSSFYCNGDLTVVSGVAESNSEALNGQGQAFYLDPSKNEVIRVSLDGRVQFLKVLPFQKMKWNRETESEFPSRFKFTTDKKTWFAVEAATESDDVVRHLFCQRD